MAATGQSEPLWHELSKEIALLLVEQVASQVPIAGPIAVKILRMAVSSENEVSQQLARIQEDTKVMREGALHAGIEFLSQAEFQSRVSGNHQERITSFIDQAAHQFTLAINLAENAFERAVTMYYLATCLILRGDSELGKSYFQRAYASALSYLKEKEKPAYDAYVTYQNRLASISQVRETGGELGQFAGGGAVVGGLALLLIGGVINVFQYGPHVLFIVVAAGAGVGAAFGRGVAGAIGEARQSAAQRAYLQARRKFEEETPPPVRDFIEGLKVLETERPDIHFTSPEHLHAN